MGRRFAYLAGMKFDAETPPPRRLLPLQVAAPDILEWLLGLDPQAIGSWRELGQEEYARAFTAAQTAGYDIVDDLYFALVDNVARGGTEADFSKLVTPILRQKGWLGGDERQIASRVALIYDTNLRLARASGRWTHYQAGKAAAPYLRAFTVRDERVRHPPKSPHSDHRAWDGIVLSIDHPFWRSYWPPLGFRCRCAVVQMTRSELARWKGGITTEGDLADRITRLGPPVFASPALPIEVQLATMVGASNAGNRIPGLPPIDPRQTAQAGGDAFDAILRASTLHDVGRQLDALFGRGTARAATAARPPVAPVAPPPPPVVREFRSPVDTSVNAETIKVEPRLALQKAMRPDFAKAAADPRYQAKREFSDRTEKDFGTATFSAAFDDEAVSMIAALRRELDDIADQVGVPRLRGVKSITGAAHIANQGDGVLALNPTYFNGYAARVGGRGAGVAAADIEAKRNAIAEEIRPIAERLKALNEARRDVTLSREERFALYAEQEPLLAAYNKLRAKDEALWRKGNVLKSADAGGVKPATTWRPGDDPKGRPFSTGSYFEDGVDQARMTLFHEFGHHVHQYLNRQGPRRQFGTPPLERELVGIYRQAMQARGSRQASTYSTKNEHEWFAENFALFVMGRRDLVDESALALIERIFRGLY